MSFAGTVPTGGKTVSIQTSFGYTATLVHLGSIGVARGALVGEASVVGTVGPSGVVDLPDPYVYFGARVTSDPQGYIDPLTLLPPRVASDAPPATEVNAEPAAVRPVPAAAPVANAVAGSASETAHAAPEAAAAASAVASAPSSEAVEPRADSKSPSEPVGATTPVEPMIGRGEARTIRAEASPVTSVPATPWGRRRGCNHIAVLSPATKRRTNGQGGGRRLRGARSRSRRQRSCRRRPDRPAEAGGSQQRWVSQRSRLWSHCAVVCDGSRSTRSLSWIQVTNFYITTPIYYVNSTPHIGHAYTTIAADILTRHHKQRGDETFFLTGTDEHGSKVYRVAEEQGLDPKTYVDQIAEAWKELPRLVDAEYDFFIRTTDDGHKRFVQEFIQRIYDNGDIYQDVYAGLYCVGCEEFKSEAELVDGKCPDHGTVPEWIEETNYFFRLSAYQQPLARPLRRAAGLRPAAVPLQRGARASSRAGCRTSASAARASPGASRSPGTRVRSSTSGSTRSSTT